MQGERVSATQAETTGQLSTHPPPIMVAIQMDVHVEERLCESATGMIGWINAEDSEEDEVGDDALALRATERHLEPNRVIKETVTFLLASISMAVN